MQNRATALRGKEQASSASPNDFFKVERPLEGPPGPPVNLPLAPLPFGLSPQAILKLSSQQRIDSTDHESIAISLASLQGLLQDKERKLFVSRIRRG